MGVRLTLIGALIAPIVFLTAIAPSLAGPAPAFDLPEIRYQDGLLGDAQLGASMAMVSELIDVSDGLKPAASQTFIDQTFAELAKMAPELSPASIDAERAALRTADHQAPDMSRQFTAFSGPILSSWTENRKLAFFVGSLSSQVAFNALVLHDPKAGNDFRRVLAGLPAIDSYIPAASDLRRSLLTIDDTDWNRAFIAAHALQYLIVHAGAPPTRGTIAILLGAHRITDAGPRKGTLHTFVELIGANGTRRTIAGYQDGAWALPHGTLHCRFDDEPNTSAYLSFILLGPGDNGPLQLMLIAAGSGQPQLVNSLVAGCRAFEADATTRPVKYSATGYTDNSVVYTLIARVSPSDVVPLDRLIRSK